MSNTINLLPLRQNPCQIKIKQIQKIICLILLIISIIYIAYKINIYQINKSIYSLNNKLASLEQQASEADALAEQLKKYQEKISHIKTNQAKSAKLIKFLSDLPSSIPNDLYLVNLSWQNNMGIIYGQAKTNSIVVKFLHALKDHSDFKKIELIKSDERHEKDNTPPIYFVINFHD